MNDTVSEENIRRRALEDGRRYMSRGTTFSAMLQVRLAKTDIRLPITMFAVRLKTL